MKLISSNDHAVVVRKYPVKLSNSDYQVKRLPSGAVCIPMGRKNIGCESGLHKWGTKMEYGLPIMVCTACGYRMHRDLLDKTMTKKEVIKKIQIGMDAQKTKLPVKPKSLEEIRKAKEKLVIELFERHQREWKKEGGTGKEVRRVIPVDEVKPE